MKHVGVGLTVKSGWAAMVLVCRADRLELLESRLVELSDPAVPESRQPFHDGFAKALAPGRELTRPLASIRTHGSRALADALDQQLFGSGKGISCAGVVVGSLVDPESLGNTHMRIHAREGQLFRELVVGALTARGIRTQVFRSRDLDGVATGVLGRSESAIRTTVAQLGKSSSGPWRAEQKAAALAAWLTLSIKG